LTTEVSESRIVSISRRKGVSNQYLGYQSMSIGRQHGGRASIPRQLLAERPRVSSGSIVVSHSPLLRLGQDSGCGPSTRRTYQSAGVITRQATENINW